MFLDIFNENKKMFIIVGSCLVFVILLSLFDGKENPDKLSSSLDYVYTSRSDEESKLPYINLVGEDIIDINSEILTKYLLITKKKDGYMNYNYSVYSDIISLVVLITDSEGNIENITYNISIKDKKLLSSNELISKFNLTYEQVKTIMENYIAGYYNYEISKGYIAKNCNFNCYINNYDIDIYSDYNFFISDNDLYIYKKFNTTYDFLYDENNPFSLFKFKIS